MEEYDLGYLNKAEERIEQIRSRALKKAQMICPAAEYVIDARSLDDYLVKNWDYPGTFYVFFKLPTGFKSEEALIDTIAVETAAFYLTMAVAKRIDEAGGIYKRQLIGIKEELLRLRQDRGFKPFFPKTIVDSWDHDDELGNMLLELAYAVEKLNGE